jgi:tetratricopeptide (TPR) repeat protein
MSGAAPFFLSNAGMIMRHALVLIAAACALTCAMSTADAAPRVPDDDATILERLPERGNPALLQLKRMRGVLEAHARDIEFAAPVARRAIEAARSTGDPRFLGQAQAALAPWWTGKDVPEIALVLRATVKQSQHDFPGALADLDLVLDAHPRNGQARLTRATILTVQGRYAEAKRDCAALAGYALPLIVATCEAGPASLSGDATAAYAKLSAELARPAQDAGVREWAATLAGEIAARRSDIATAERHFREALMLDPRDPYLKGGYADLLIDAGRARDALQLLRDDTRNDSLLLRLALAEQAVPEAAGAFSRHRDELRARFDAARRRGDSLHRREEARFRLDIEHDAEGALKLARENWSVQREPADLVILAAAAKAAGDASALRIVRDWIDANHLEDARSITLADTGS